MKPLIWRQAAIDDAAEAASCYAGEGGLALELAFIDALEMACRRIVEQPAMGSTRHANLFPQLPVPLRYLPLARFKRYLLYQGSPGLLPWPRRRLKRSPGRKAPKVIACALGEVSDAAGGLFGPVPKGCGPDRPQLRCISAP